MMREGHEKSGFTLIEVLVAMTVLIMLVMGMTRLFTQASAISNQGMTGIARNSVAETAMETILQDVDGMIVNERLGCYIESDAVDAANEVQGGFGFDDAWFVSTSGDQDDDMPYEYFHYYVKQTTATNSLGAEYVRFDLHKARMIMAVGDKNHAYALEKGKANWWTKLENLGANQWDDQILAENVVQFDIYCKGWDGRAWMNGKGSSTEFDSRLVHYAGSGLGPNGDGNVTDVPPATFDVVLQVTSPDAAMEGGMALAGNDNALKMRGRELMIKESATYFGRAVPMTGASQLHHPENHYFE